MNVKVIKKTSISILEQNNLNYGFITSNIEYQYYFMDIFKDQEGEIMILNKRQEGILIANLIEKSKEIDLKNINTYPKKDHIDSLKFNQHTLKLSFNYKNNFIL